MSDEPTAEEIAEQYGLEHVSVERSMVDVGGPVPVDGYVAENNGSEGTGRTRKAALRSLAEALGRTAEQGDDDLRDELAEEVKDARTVFVVFEDDDGYWAEFRDTDHDGHEATAACLTAAISARESAREFLDDVAADDPELLDMAEDAFAETNAETMGRR